MKTSIAREMKINKYTYSFNGHNENNLSAYSNHSSLFSVKKCIVISGSDKIMLKETSLFLKVLNALPLLNTETFEPFCVLKNGNVVSRSQKVFLKPYFTFNIENKTYKLSLNGNNHINISVDNLSAADYYRETISYAENCTYEVDFDCSLISREYVLLFCMFIDYVFFRNHTSFSGIKYEKWF